MFPYHSPVRQNTGYNDVNNSPSISSRVPISLHGLFGETLGMDDQTVTSFSLQQSPPCGSYVSSKRTNSKSPIYSNGSGQFQTVLLSELADITPQNGLIDFSYQRSAICSYISPYDNRRCTYLAITALDSGKSFCAKHSELSGLVAFSPEINNNPSIGYQPIQPHLNNSNKLKDEFELQNNYQIKSDANPGPTLNTLNLNQEKNTNPYPMNNINIKSPIRIPNGNNNRRNKNTNSLSKSKTFVQPLNGQHSHDILNEVGTKGKKVLNNGGMDGDVLQAVVDLLNKNHDRLTSKQQIELLNSLGVMVTTINNPNDLVRGNPANGLNVGNSGSFNTPFRNENFRYLEKKIILKNKNSSVMAKSQLNENNLQKRKMDVVESGSGKKMKKVEALNSLSHLSSVELDVRVSEAIASIGGFNSNRPSSKPHQISVKKSVKSPSFARKVNTPLPTVDILMNPAITVSELRIDKSKKEVLEYAHHLLDEQINLKGLFPIGPMCSDAEKNVCACKNLDFKFDISKSKQKHATKQLTKLGLSQKCRNRNCRGTGKFVPSNNLQLNLDIIWQHADQQMTDYKTNSKNACKLIKHSKKLYKSALKSEKHSLKLLVNSVKTDINATAALLKQVEPSKVSLSRRHITDVKTSQFCKLKDSTGKYFCRKKTLPLSCYCQEHILHCDYQQLYRPGPDMKVRADIVPEFPMIRPRKKTKVLPLSKRKKRKIKKNKILTKTIENVKTGDGSICIAATNQKETGLLNGQDVLLSQPLIYTSPEMEQYDEKTSVMKSEDVSFTENLNMSDESLSIMVDEDSTSAALESFSLDGTLLNEVMPEVFQDLAFLGGQGGDNLDSTYLLGNSKLNFEELTANSLFYSNSEASELLNGGFPNDVNTLNEVFVDKSRNETPMANHFKEKDCSQKESELQKTWNHDYCNSLEFPDNNDSSFDSSFAEELNELEGVIQSLQEETDSQSLTKINDNSFDEMLGNGHSTANENLNPTNCSVSLQTTLNSSIDSNNLAQNDSVYNVSTTNPYSTSEPSSNHDDNISLNTSAQTSNTNQSILYSNMDMVKSEMANQSLLKSPKKAAKYSNSGSYPTEQIKQDDLMKTPPQSSHQVYVTNSIFKDSGFNKNNPIPLKTKPNISTFNYVPMSQVTAKSNTTKKQTNLSKTLVTDKKSTKSRKLNVKNVKLQMDQLLPTLHKQSLDTKLEENLGLQTMKFSTLATVPPPVNNQKSDKILMSPSNGKSRQKSSNHIGIPGHTAPMVQQGVAPTFRIQSGLVNGGIMCAGSNPVGGRGMVLIPVNAVMRPTTDHQNHLSNNGMGLTFAVPAQNGFNSQIGAVLRCSAMLSNDNQKIFVLNGMPTTNLVGAIPTSNTQNQNSKSLVNTSGQTVVLPATRKAPINNKHKSIVIAPALSQINPESAEKSEKPKPIHNINRQSLVIPPATIPPTTHLKKNKNSGKATAIDNGGTVHWNPTSGGQNNLKPPVPRPKEHGTVGGQTSNMLYCRRISPSLNNIDPQHVVLSRIGSLGRVGLSHLKVAEKMNLKATSLKRGFKKEVAKTGLVSNAINGADFNHNHIQVKDSNISTSGTNLNVVESAPQNLAIQRQIELFPPQISLPSVKLQTSKHNCRKTGHTTIKDPDLIEAKN